MENPFNILQQEKKRRQQYFALAEGKNYRHAEEVWHRLSRGTYIGDAVYGASDGIVTTFAVVAGAAGAAFSPAIVIILGLANLAADGFSMGASKFLSLRSERKFIASQRRREQWETENFPELEKEETRAIFRRWGFSEELARQATDIVIRDEKKWVDLMMKDELHLPEDNGTKAGGHGFATFAAFVAAGGFPLLPFLFGNFPDKFLASAVLAALAFFAVGAARTFVTSESPWRAGAETLLVGGLAAALAYFLGWVMKTIFAVAI